MTYYRPCVDPAENDGIESSFRSERPFLSASGGRKVTPHDEEMGKVDRSVLMFAQKLSKQRETAV